MPDAHLLHELIACSAQRTPRAVALTAGNSSLTYAELHAAVQAFAAGLLGLGTGRGERVAIWLDKRVETVVASFGAPAAGAVFVPVNPLLKPEQVGHILRDCNVRVLVIAPERLAGIAATLADCPDLRHLVLTGAVAAPSGASPLGGAGAASAAPALPCTAWNALLEEGATAIAGFGTGVDGDDDRESNRVAHRVVDLDMAAILYTSGSTGRPKGVVLSHRNMVAGAKSVAGYLENHAGDTLLAALPLSFDAGFSQLTTAFHVGARAVLVNYLLPRDVLNAVVRERVTGLTAVPPLWIQLAQLDWPAGVTEHLRYIANTGGRMPLATLTTLRERLPRTRPFLMYGLTEAFRATYLPPEEAARRPDSIGRAIPNAEVLVLRDDGTECAADEPGELVQRGALVGMGYWNDPEKTAERYRPLPAGLRGRPAGLVIPELAVFSGDTVRRDAEGFLYFVGRRDEMIKTSGYRVSPTEVEEIVYATKRVGEVAAFGVPHPRLGDAIVLVVAAAAGETVDVAALQAECRKRFPAYMLPSHIEPRPGPLPRNPNGKIDRKALAAGFENLFEGAR